MRRARVAIGAVRYARTVLNGLGAQRKGDAAKMPPDGQTVRPFVINEKLHDLCSAAAEAIDRFFGGDRDKATLDILRQ